MDLSKIAFDSRLNYLKRGFTGSQTVTLGGAGATSTVNVAHNLGYVPFFVVGANLTNTTTIWSNDRVEQYTQTSLSGVDLDIRLRFWSTTNTLTIQIRNGDGALAQSGNRTVYWAIYLDYNA
jgi:hypothetical protein